MARILLSAYACEPDRGSEPAVGWNWAVELARQGHQVWVLTRAGNRASIERQPRPELNFIYYDLPRWMQGWRTFFAGKRLYYVLWQWGVAQYIRKRFPDLPFDVVHHVTYVSVRYPTFLGSLGIPLYFGPVSGGERIPLKLREGLSAGERRRVWLRDLSNRMVALDPLLWNVFRRAEKIIVTPESVSLVPRRWRHKCDARLAIGLTGEYLSKPTVRVRCSEHPFRLLFVGRLLESKGIDIALRAVRQLVEWQLDVRFVIVGDGPARSRLIKLADALQISDVVEWTGCIAPAAVEGCYRAADLFLFPSLCDSGGMAVLEALAHGLPVVCPELGGPGAIVTWRCGRLLPALEASREELAAGFACAVSEILNTPGLRSRLSAGAKARAREFDFEHLVSSVYPDSLRPALHEKHEYTLQLSEWYRATLPTDPLPRINSHSRAVGCWRGLVACSLFAIIFLPEFPHEGAAAGSFVYAKAAASFRFIDVGILALVLIHLSALACSRGRALFFPRALLLPGTAFLLCIATGIAYGRLNGGSNFFFDWRALALGIGLYLVWAFWMRTADGLRHVVLMFVTYMAARIALLYGLYLAGRGETLLGIPIPTFDGPALSAIVFTALLAFRCREGCTNAKQKLGWTALAAASYLIILLCFRRTYWGELAIGTGILLLLQRRRIRNLVLTGAVICLAALVLGKPFAARVQSLDVMQEDGEFSADNSDHLHDLQDAWDQVRQAPWMGIGVGTSYPTWRIRNWKNESVMVHNAPIHVWLKYGLAGMLCYLWFHAVLLRWLYVRSKYVSGNNAAFLSVAFAYLTAQFVMTLGFTPWPYSELQLTTLTSFILAAAFLSGSRSLPGTWTTEGLGA